MDCRRIRLTGLAAASGLAAFVSAGDVLALEVGCRPATLVRQHLQQESQFVLVSGYGVAAGFPKNIFTANERGSLGYQVEAGVGADAEKLCVTAKYTDINVNPNRSFARPSWANFGSASEFDRWLVDQEHRNQEKIIFGATSVVRLKDNSEVTGSFIIVSSGNVPSTVSSKKYENSGAVNLVAKDGKATPIMVLVNVETARPNYENFAARAALGDR